MTIGAYVYYRVLACSANTKCEVLSGFVYIVLTANVCSKYADYGSACARYLAPNATAKRSATWKRKKDVQ